MSLFALVLVVALLIAVQGFLLQTACAIAGERPPTYGDALVNAMIAGFVAFLASSAFGCTFGIVIGLFSKYLAWFGSAAIGAAVAANVYRTRMFLPTNQALAVAVIHHLLAWAISAAVWALVAWWF